MKIIILISVFLFANALKNDELMQKWNEFKLTNDKLYRSALEERRRFSIFKDNLQHIEEHNTLYETGHVSYQKGITSFADMTEKEFLDFVGQINYNEQDKPAFIETYVAKEIDPTAEVDWRNSGAVTDVKNQGQCGSCWSFSTTGALEGRNQIKTGQLLSLSEQNLVDCAKSYGTYGCSGGFMVNAFNYVKNHGITTEEKYPYTAKDEGVCYYNNKDNALNITGFVEVESKNEVALRSAVHEGPTSVAVCVTGNFQLYTEGVFFDDKCNQDALNHAVLAVGYGRDNGHNYWLLKNSWGPTWGLNGYMKLQMGVNHCGVATLASFPKI